MWLLGTDPDIVKHFKLQREVELLKLNRCGDRAICDYDELEGVKNRPLGAIVKYDLFDHDDLF